MKKSVISAMCAVVVIIQAMGLSAQAEVKLYSANNYTESEDEEVELSQLTNRHGYEKDLEYKNQVSDSIADQLSGRKPASVSGSSNDGFSVSLIRVKNR